jgi:hypothetical protein
MGDWFLGFGCDIRNWYCLRSSLNGSHSILSRRIMNCQQELKDYTDEELEVELDRRNFHRKKGECSYCHEPFGRRDWCKFHESGEMVNGEWCFWGGRIKKAIPYITKRNDQ